jgi:hypothetical protein
MSKKKRKIDPNSFCEDLFENEKHMGEGAAIAVTCEQYGIDIVDACYLMSESKYAKNKNTDSRTEKG